MILIKNIEIYGPRYLGIKDVLIGGGRIILIGENIKTFSEKIRLIDGNGKRLIPGLIDSHVHITGGGGEDGFKSRVPELTITNLIKGGITTLVGLLGTDDITRNIENLLAKAKSLKEEGVSAYICTGSYGYPTITLTGSVKKDIVFVDEIIGAKLALSDHRVADIGFQDLSRLVANVRVAGMLSGKAGILTVHMGDGEGGLGLINDLVKKTELPITSIRPTHVNRREGLLVEAFEFAKEGGIIDFTCGIEGKLAPARLIQRAEELGVPLNNITFSSDGYGSWSKYDKGGNLVEIGISPVDSLYNEVKKLVLEFNLDLEKALQFVTSNVSRALKIYPQKGVIKEGADADLLVINKDMDIDRVIARGNLMMEDGKLLKKPTYE